MRDNLDRSTPTSGLIWLTFTTKSRTCGRQVVTRRLIEYDFERKKLLYLFPISRKVYYPPDVFLQGRGYKRPHELDPNPLSDPEFIKILKKMGVVPMGTKIS